MSHPNDDQLLLYSYGELPEAERPAVDAHLTACSECRGRFARLEESRVGLDWGLEHRPAGRVHRLVWLALPLAAGIGALLLLRQPTGVQPPEREAWQSHLVGSPHAGYVAGGAAFMTIDSQLVRLEQGRIRGTPQN